MSPTRRERRFEYLVRWQRHGLRPARSFYQTEKAARDKVARLIRLDEEKKVTHVEVYGQAGGSMEWEDPYRNMPDLLDTPTIERRTVGDWEANPS